jgi:hypothetical protein
MQHIKFNNGSAYFFIVDGITYLTFKDNKTLTYGKAMLYWSIVYDKFMLEGIESRGKKI